MGVDIELNLEDCDAQPSHRLSSLKASFNHECVPTSEEALGGRYFRAVATDFDTRAGLQGSFKVQGIGYRVSSARCLVI